MYQNNDLESDKSAFVEKSKPIQTDDVLVVPFFYTIIKLNITFRHVHLFYSLLFRIFYIDQLTIQLKADQRFVT